MSMAKPNETVERTRSKQVQGRVREDHVTETNAVKFVYFIVEGEYDKTGNYAVNKTAVPCSGKHKR